MIDHADARILVFAKAPDIGQVKTRLIPALGAHGAAELHEKLVRHTLTTATQTALCPVALWCAPSSEHPFFENCRAEFGITLHTQQGSDLGERMHHALTITLQQCAYAVLIGTDCPALTAHELHQALALLQQGVDAVLGPAQDGGYVLIGVCRTHPEIFNEVKWGASTVLNETRARLHSLEWRWHELSEQWDVDRPEDLQRLEALLKSHVSRAIK